MTTPTEARALADKLEARERYAVADALRSLADQVEAADGQALSSIERAEYFAMKKDAERYQVCRNQSSAEFIIQDRVNSLLSLTPQGVDDACDRAREAT
jgi:hypothetical protein